MAATLAEYLDSEPELRAWRDAMLAMTDEFEEVRRHPHWHAADAEGIVRIRQRMNTFTGEWLDVVADIHHDDVDWLLRLWEQGDMLDYEIWRASCCTG